MKVSELAPAVGYPHIQEFITNVLDMQFGDVRAMLQIPRPDIGIRAGCNFAIASTLCNLISGISTTIYKPLNLLHEVRSKCRSDAAFRGLVADHFAYAPAGVTDFPDQLYGYCRNPLVHSPGIKDASPPIVAYSRILHSSHPNVGWDDNELEDLERPDRPFDLAHPSIVIDPPYWTLHGDSFYLEVIDMLRRLTSDSAQMVAAEGRFNQGVYNWRTP